MILNCMLGTGYGGLEKLFLDEIEMLPLAGLAARGLVSRKSPLARYARDRGLAFDEMMALSKDRVDPRPPGIRWGFISAECQFDEPSDWIGHLRPDRRAKNDVQEAAPEFSRRSSWLPTLCRT